MRLFEYDAKAISQKSGIRVPKGAITAALEEVKKIFNETGGPDVKSRILVAGGSSDVADTLAKRLHT